MKSYVKEAWNKKSEKEKSYIINRKRIRIENDENPKNYVFVILPIEEGELNDVMGDMLGRDDEGFVIHPSSVSWHYECDKAEIQDIYLENELVLSIHKMKEPEYAYGDNPAITTKDGEIFRGSLWYPPNLS